MPMMLIMIGSVRTITRECIWIIFVWKFKWHRMIVLHKSYASCFFNRAIFRINLCNKISNRLGVIGNRFFVPWEFRIIDLGLICKLLVKISNDERYKLKTWTNYANCIFALPWQFRASLLNRKISGEWQRSKVKRKVGYFARWSQRRDRNPSLTGQN